MKDFCIPQEKKKRVIINTDAKNEVDDQFAIVQALLSQSFDLKGIIAAHFGEVKSSTSMLDSYNEILKLLHLMNLDGKFIVKKGAEKAMINETTPQVSEGAKFIVEEAMKDDERPLYIAFMGAITDMAAAILMEPKILEKDIKVVWIGGGDYPVGRNEFNLKNDVTAANVVFKSGIEIWQIPRNVYRMMPVSFAELHERVEPYGEIGKYLATNVYEFNNLEVKRPGEYRVLGDSPSVGVIIYEDAGTWSMVKKPTFNPDMTYNYDGDYGNIRLYNTMNSRFIFEDFYAKLKMFVNNK